MRRAKGVVASAKGIMLKEVGPVKTGRANLTIA
jgi:hypothetical protein